MPTGHYRFRRSLGNVGSRFRGARPDTYPLYTGVLDSYPGAAAAYSLRALSRGWLAGDVVEVRRDSDSTSQDFTASQITNGQMLSFVNHDTTSLYNSARYFNGTSTIVDLALDVAMSGNFTQSLSFFCNDVSAQSTLINSASGQRGFTISAGTPSQRIDSSLYTFSTITVSENVKYSATIERDGSNLTLTLIGGGSTQSETIGSVTASDLVVEGIGERRGGSDPFMGLIWDVNLNGQAAYTGLGTSVTAWEDTIGSNDGTESNGAAYTGQPFDGFVTTWYDQSGNANDATQIATASQPKIVDAGALVTGGLDFDGVDDELDFDSAIDFSNGDWLISAVVKWDGNSSPIVGSGISQWALQVALTTHFSARATNDSVIHNFTPSTNFVSGAVALASIYRSSDVLYGSKDGAEDIANPAIASGDTFSADRIGRRGAAFNSSPIAEIIIYNTDQYANRAGIETNINDHYSIYA